MPNPYQQYFKQANDPTPEDRIRALMNEANERRLENRDGTIKKMPLLKPMFPQDQGPLLERGPYVPKPNDGPYIQEMQAPPKKNNNGGYGFLRQETDEEYARRKGRENGIE
jgi:hypothetical protein